MSEEKKVDVVVTETDTKIIVVIKDYELAEYLMENSEDWELYFDTDVKERPLLVIKFYKKMK